MLSNMFNTFYYFSHLSLISQYLFTLFECFECFLMFREGWGGKVRERHRLEVECATPTRGGGPPHPLPLSLTERGGPTEIVLEPSPHPPTYFHSAQPRAPHPPKFAASDPPPQVEGK